MKKHRGIILAAGSGTRLYPLTISISKQLLPIYDKPMIYYPLSSLMLAGIRDILIITTPQDKKQFERLLGDGSHWGINLQYKVQPRPDGIAQAFILAEDFLNGSPSVMILGDNLFFGQGFPDIIGRAISQLKGATIFSYHVSDPERYGVVSFSDSGIVKSIEEKPKKPITNYAVTGLYVVDSTAPERAKALKPSARSELEITTLLQSYLKDKTLRVEKMGRGYAWLDTGTFTSLLDASNFVKTLSERQGLQIGSPDEIANTKGWITNEQLMNRAKNFEKNKYGKYLKSLLEK